MECYFISFFFVLENIGVFVDQNGKLLQTERICWSEAPTAIVIQNPYAIALLPRRVEVCKVLREVSLVLFAFLETCCYVFMPFVLIRFACYEALIL